MRNPILAASLLIATIALGVFANVQEKTKQNEATLAGTWQAIEAELGGKPLPPEVVRTIKLILSAHEYQVGNDFGTVEINPDTTPASLIIKGTKGPNEGKTMLAIYELSGDTLRICYDLTGQKRPSIFATEAGTRQFLVRYKKEESKQ